MINVLFLTAFPPSENSAGEKNTKLMLAELSKFCDVDIIYFRDEVIPLYQPESPHIHVVKVIKNSRLFRVVNALKRLYLHPLFTVRYDTGVMKIIHKLLGEKNYDVIVFDHSQTFLYANKVNSPVLKILYAHDVEAQRIDRHSNRFLSWLCRRTENKLLKAYNSYVFTVSQKDIDLIYNYYNIQAFLSVLYLDQRIIDNTPTKIRDEYVMFGNWVRKDNYEGAVWLLNGLGEYLNRKITVNIIGKKFPMDRIAPHKNIRIENLGFVDNPYPIIAEAKAMLCPLFSGAGIKVKVIESLASGTPVIGTDIAFEGFDKKFGDFMLRCDNLSSFADKISEVNYGLHERKLFKEEFIIDYQSMTIPKWIEKHIGE